MSDAQQPSSPLSPLDRDEQISLAHKDRAHVPDLCRLLMRGSLIVIGSWEDAEATRLRLQDFVIDDRPFLPLFSDRTQFWGQLGSTPYFDKGLEIDCRHLIPMLHGDELLILNPGSTAPVQMTKADFAPFL